MPSKKKTPKMNITALVEKYEKLLRDRGIPKKRMDPARSFASLTTEEVLSHAHFLCDRVKKYAGNPGKQRKTGSHFAAVQMCLSFTGWLTLQEMMDDNRSM